MDDAKAWEMRLGMTLDCVVANCFMYCFSCFVVMLNTCCLKINVITDHSLTNVACSMRYHLPEAAVQQTIHLEESSFLSFIL